MLKRIASRKQKKNHMIIIAEAENKENAVILEKEIRKAVRKWNRLVAGNLSYQIVTVTGDGSTHAED
ncbi:MAG: hypothetical protein ACI4CZ_04645 [Hominisplanchenecus sp.]